MLLLCEFPSVRIIQINLPVTNRAMALTLKNQGSLLPEGKAEQLHIFEFIGSKQCESEAPAH